MPETYKRHLVYNEFGNVGILLSELLETNFGWNSNQFTQNFSFMKTRFKMSSMKWRPFCPGCGNKIDIHVVVITAGGRG